MESINALRTYCDSLEGATIDDNHVSAEYVAKRTAINVRRYVNAIEQELEGRYMELPLDADGVPIRVGDEMESDNERFVVCAVAPGRVHRWHIHNIGELDKGTVAYPPTSLHHFKPRTVEDVLLDAGVSIAAISDVAAEIRELMEVE